ncbi:hypothetical protein QE152_g6903 [Popillia japonica]|uniref:Uncharacterized protein n=1 Tax=Popillia japonica TaxID=7064 RepID=A0AAW1MFW1_POPJA
MHEETQKELQKLWQEFLSDEDPFDKSSGDEYILELSDSVVLIPSRLPKRKQKDQEDEAAELACNTIAEITWSPVTGDNLKTFTFDVPEWVPFRQRPLCILFFVHK